MLQKNPLYCLTDSAIVAVVRCEGDGHAKDAVDVEVVRCKGDGSRYESYTTASTSTLYRSGTVTWIQSDALRGRRVALRILHHGVIQIRHGDLDTIRCTSHGSVTYEGDGPR